MAVRAIQSIPQPSPLSPPAAMLSLIAPGPDARGALLSGAGEPAMTSQYRVTYKVIPPGVGPDDYEPGDLEQCETVLALADPEPAFFVGNDLHSYGPPRPDVIRALAPLLPEGAHPIIRSVDPA